MREEVVTCYERLAPLYTPRTRAAIRDDYLKPLLTLPHGMQILDAGCGTGHDALSLAEAGHRVTGIDVSPAMCRVARELLRGRENVEIIEGDIETHDFGSMRFDAVLSSMEIFHHDDLGAALSKYASYTVNGGLLVLVTNHPVRNVLLHPGWDYFNEGLCWEDWGTHGRIPKYHWTLRHYVDDLLTAGFRHLCVREYPATPDLVSTQDVGLSHHHNYPSIMSFIARKVA